jgi:predicted RNA-binding protein (virulence factor B family)
VFSLKRGLGAMVAVEGKYLGLIHEGEILKPLHSGDIVEVRVSNVKEDGKLDLSLKDAPRLQIDNDGEKILNAVVKNKGLLPLNDDSNPEDIKNLIGLSKSSFKKAVGRLMKRNVIEMTREGIRLSDGNKKTYIGNNRSVQRTNNKNDRNDKNSRTSRRK